MKTIAILLALLSLCACAVDDGYPEAIPGEQPVLPYDATACDVQADGDTWAVADFDHFGRNELAVMHALGYAPSALGFEYRQVPSFVRNRQAAVNCTEHGIDHVVFVLRLGSDDWFTPGPF